MSAYLQQAGFPPRRAVAITLSVGLQALVIFALLSAIGIVNITQEPPVPRLQVNIEEVKQKPIRVVNTDPVTQLRQTTVVQGPIDPIRTDEDPPQTQTPEQKPGPPGDVVVVGPGSGPVLAATGLQYLAVRPADDYYPPASIRMAEEGVATVRVCVDTAGRVEGVPVVAVSSGSKRLDAAALVWVREALRFTPATRDGVAVASCKGFRVNFTLH